MGPSVGVDGCGLSRLPPGFDHRTVQPVASRYIDLIGFNRALYSLSVFLSCCYLLTYLPHGSESFLRR